MKESFFLGLLMIMMYSVEYSGVLNFISYDLRNNVMIPAMWIAIIAIILFKMPKNKLIDRLKYQPYVRLSAFNCGVVWVISNIFIGVVMGFGNSPYSHTLESLFKNLVVITSTLMGRELIREHLIYNIKYRNIVINMLIVTIGMTITELNLTRIVEFKHIEELTIFVAEQILPQVSHNIVATYLVTHGGAVASMIYLGIREGFEWFSPILPNINWLTKGVMGMGIPLISLMIITQKHDILTKKIKQHREVEKNLWHWMPTAIFTIGLVWFTVGVFPIYPSAVATGSMQPMIDPGDVVLVHKMQTQEELEQLEIGEVIQFTRDDILINHRIINIIDTDDGLKLYETKGDNNSSADTRLVKMEEVKGTIETVIPKIGWPTILFKNNKVINDENIEF